MNQILRMIPKENAAVMPGEGVFQVPETLLIENLDFSEECILAFTERMRLENRKEGPAWLFIRKADGYGEEGYSLEVREQAIDVEASCEAGVIWALTTLLHLIEDKKTEDNQIPVMRLEGDYPAYAHRGLMLDCARHFFDVDEVKRVIEQISLAKMNRLHWHLSDDQGFRIESRVFPMLHMNEGQKYYTQDEIREVVRFAARRGVEVIPEIDMPGHTLALISAFPGLSCRPKERKIGKRGGIYPVVLCPGKDQVFEFIDKLLEEVTGLFPSKWFHMGGDEVPGKAWDECPGCQKRMQSLGLDSTRELQGYFETRVAETLHRLGKNPVCWNDCLHARNCPEGVAVQYWAESEAEEVAPEFYEKGGPVIFADMFHCYLDYPHAMIPLEKVYALRPGFGEVRENCMGVEGCLWTEHIEDAKTLEEKIFPRIFAIAEVGWTKEENLDYESFEERLKVQAETMREDSIAVTPEEGWNPEGAWREEEILGYARLMMAPGAPDEDEDESEAPVLAATDEFRARINQEFFRPEDKLLMAKLMAGRRAGQAEPAKKQAFNPYLLPENYIPDGEPHVFDGRVYVYGSHDEEGGKEFCALDYEVFSAPVDDLTDWRSEGIAYRADQDPDFSDRYCKMYAPDVVRGNDGRYYLYYAMSGGTSFTGPIHAAVSGSPAGPFTYHGCVRNPDGSPFTKNITFDPGVINDGGVIRLYYGWSLAVDPAVLEARASGGTADEGKAGRPDLEEQLLKVQMQMFEKTEEEVKDAADGIMGANTVELEDDMLTVKGEPVRIVPGQFTAKGTSFEGHAFFEASSVRKIGELYYFIYSSQWMHELCYAVSKYPDRGFTYGGVIVSNGDIGYQGREKKDCLAMTGNNHGSIECINGEWYIFYHRHTHKTSFSRQGCAERITVLPDGSIPQVEMTSCGLNRGPLAAEGSYPAVIACNLTNGHMPMAGMEESEEKLPFITNDGNERFIADITDGTLIGYKYFRFEGNVRLTLTLRGEGEGRFEIYTGEWQKASLVLQGHSDWIQEAAEIEAYGEYALYMRYTGSGRMQLKEIAFDRQREEGNK